MSKKPAFRRSQSLLRTVLLAVALAACCAAQPLPANAQGDRGGMPGDFDYYVLALSWSPTYCSSHGGESGGDRDSGYDNDSGSRDEDRGYSGGRYGERRDHGRRGMPNSAVAPVLMLSCFMDFGRNTSVKAGRSFAKAAQSLGCPPRRSTA